MPSTLWRTLTMPCHLIPKLCGLSLKGSCMLRASRHCIRSCFNLRSSLCWLFCSVLRPNIWGKQFNGGRINLLHGLRVHLLAGNPWWWEIHGGGTHGVCCWIFLLCPLLVLPQILPLFILWNLSSWQLVIKHGFRDEHMVDVASSSLLPSSPSFSVHGSFLWRLLFMTSPFYDVSSSCICFPSFRQGLYFHLYLRPSLWLFSPTVERITNAYWCVNFTALKLDTQQWMLTYAHLLCSHLCLLCSHFLRQKVFFSLHSFWDLFISCVWLFFKICMRKVHQILWDYSYRWLWATIWVLETGLRISGKTTNVPNHWAIFPVPMNQEAKAFRASGTWMVSFHTLFLEFTDLLTFFNGSGVGKDLMLLT